MTKETKSYLDNVKELYDKIANDNPNLEAAATVMAKEIARGGLIHVIGPGGHSNMAAEEVLWRAGGLAN